MTEPQLAPATAVCRNCGDPITYGPFYPDAYPGPNPPVWRHDRGDGIGAQICATPHLRAEPAAATPNNSPTSTDAANNPLREQYAAIIRSECGSRFGYVTELLLAVHERDTAQLRAERDMALTAATEARGQVARVREAIAERRTEVAERETDGMLPFGTPGASWCDAVSVTCSRVEDALRVFPPPGLIRAESARGEQP